MTKDGDGLLLAVVCFTHPRPLRPGVLGGAGAWGFTHYLQLGNAFTALADAGAHAVVARVAAPYDDHILALCRGTVSPIQQGTGCPCQEVHCKPDVHSRPTWYVQISGLGRAAAENHRVKLFSQLLLTHVPARVHTGAEGYPLRRHQIQPPLDHRLFQLHVGDAVHQQAAGSVGPLEHGDAVTSAVKPLSAGEPGGAGAHHRHGPTGAGLGRPRGHESLLPGLLDDPQLVVLHRHRLAV